MLLTGTFPRTLDDKHRFALPKPLRDELGCPQTQVLFAAPGADGSLSLYTEETFTRVADQIALTSSGSKEGRAFARLFYAQAQRIDIDKQGRIRIPVELARWASLEREIVLIGIRDRLEVWNRETWNNWFEEKQPQYDEIADRAMIQSPESPTAVPDTEASRPTLPR